MHVLLSCSKTMNQDAALLPKGVAVTVPQFQPQAEMLASAMSVYSAEELSLMLGCSREIAADVWHCYRAFDCQSTLAPAAMRYSGSAFKELGFGSLSADDMEWANSHVTICSFLYGMLRPLDAINPYRMEAGVRLPAIADEPVIRYWRPLLTEAFIRRVEACGGTLLNLASKEMCGLFDWKLVEHKLRVVTPTFRIRIGMGRPRTTTVYSKMCRGAMSRYVILNRIKAPEALDSFEFLGFSHQISSPSEKPDYILTRG